MIPRNSPPQQPYVNGHGHGHSHGHGYGQGYGYPGPNRSQSQSQPQSQPQSSWQRQYLSITDCSEAEHARRRKEYAVYPIIPRREITLISGPPRSGTTTLLTMMCDGYRSGRAVLGYPSYSTPGNTSLLCLTHSKGAVQRIASKMGILTSELNLVVMGVRVGERDREKNTFSLIIKGLKKRNPALETVFLDGYHRLFRGNRKDYDAGADGTDSVQEVLEDENITLVAVGRSVKLNLENAEASPIERFYGSVSTTERIATFISMDRLPNTDRDSPRRVITIETQDKPIVQPWEFTNNGLLVPASQAGAENRVVEAYGHFETVVMARGEGGVIGSDEMNELGEQLGVSKATVARYRNRMIEQGLLEGSYGEYRVKGDGDDEGDGGDGGGGNGGSQ